ncbi:MAG: hypothetical protein WAO71_13655 [Gallionella sp.]
MKQLILIASACCMISGCALFTPPMEDPVRQDYVGSIFSDRKTNIFSLTPERRTVLVVRNVNNAVSPAEVVVCAEPPPDVAQNIASSIRALAEAAAKDTSGKSAGASAEFSKTLNTSVVSLFYRSQGVQLFRDGLFSLCQANMNGLIKDKEDFWTKYQALLNASFALIAQEIPTAQTLRGIDLANQTATTKTAIEAALQAAKEAQVAAEKAAEKATEAVKQVPK